MEEISKEAFVGGRFEESNLIGAPRVARLDMSSTYGKFSASETPTTEQIEELVDAGVIGQSLAPEADDVVQTSDEALTAEELEPSAGLDDSEGSDLQSVLAESETSDVDELLYALAYAAADLGKQFDGPTFAALLVKDAPVTDIRLALCIKVLSLGQKLTGDKFLNGLDELGFGPHATEARETLAEIRRTAVVPVEVVSGPIAGVAVDVIVGSAAGGLVVADGEGEPTP